MIEWKNKFETGYSRIDSQHKKLLGLINDIERILKDKSIHEDLLYDKLISIFDEILSYTAYHFKTEERQFEQYNYEESTKHIESHNLFVEDVKLLISDLKLNDNVKVVATEIYEKLINWLLEHIMIEDMKYVGKLE